MWKSILNRWFYLKTDHSHIRISISRVRGGSGWDVCEMWIISVRNTNDNNTIKKQVKASHINFIVCILLWINIVTDVINAFPCNSSVNTVQHATRDEVVFSMSSASSNSRNGILCDQLLSHATVLIIELCFLCGPCCCYITRFPELPREW
jgi:hypothetical protein